ncbi:holocytochrome c-type synthase-like [Bolinopsis microptera]|uniref:holocytochrome c-type synthase-like n=1 Tax=Bolinopsis microptera TaxID=2820187 RepID=UPI003079B580
MTPSIVEAVKAEGLQGQCPIDHTKFQQPPAPPAAAGKCPIDHTQLAAAKQSFEEETPVEEANPVAPCELENPVVLSEENVSSESDVNVDQTPHVPQKITTAQYISAQKAMSSLMSECPSAAGEPSPSIPSECPMHNTAATDPDKLMPDNMMPPPNQRAAHDQPFPLNTGRETSSIPRTGTDKNWVYPSEQMFWNAMTRKGWNWREEPEEVVPETVTEIIKIHNFNNEKAWHEILLWETFHNEECKDPQLTKFAGKPKDLSPRARFRTWLGYDAPFDRHDWVVDRCGTDVRYILDYYDTGIDQLETGEDSVEIDVRPALDSFSACFDRMKVFALRNAPTVATFLFDYPMVPVESGTEVIKET